jgi:hypothetical protein
MSVCTPHSTKRKRADEQFQKLLEAAPDAMVIVNQDGTIFLDEIGDMPITL